jgi:hypothetical protein
MEDFIDEIAFVVLQFHLATLLSIAGH